MARKREVLEAVLAGIAGLILLLGTYAHCREVANSGKFLRNDWFVSLLWLAPLLFTVRLIPRSSADTNAPSQGGTKPAFFVLVAFLFMYLFSGAARFPTFFFMNWYTRVGDARPGPNCVLDVLMLGTGLLIPLAVAWRKSISWLLPVALLALQCLCAAKLAFVTGGQAVYQDDHPSFMFRMWQFSEVFPHILTYNPYWNAGAVDSVLADTGSVAYGLLTWPLLLFFAPDRIHTLGLTLVFIFLVPWMLVLSARLFDMKPQAKWCAGILGIGVSYTFFLWMLHFGTVGSAVCSAFLVPTAACLYRVVWLDDRDWKLGLLLCVCAYILVQWPPGMVMAATLGISMLLSWRQWTWRKFTFVLLCTAIVTALHARALILIPTQSEDLMGFVMQTPHAHAHETVARTQQLAESTHRGWNTLMEALLHGHPAILFLGIGGVCFLPDRRHRVWLAPPVIALAVIGGWGEQVFPNLQISRLVIPLFFVAAMAAASHVAAPMGTEKRSEQVASAALVALLLLGAWNVSRSYGNGGYAPFATLGSDVRNMVSTIQGYAPENTRVLFAGRTVHAFGRGHIAYLPRLTQREMMACDYYAFPPQMVEYEYPPRPFRASEEGMARFLDLHGVSLILSYHHKWHDYLASQPERYEELDGFDVTGVHIYAFRVKQKASLFHEGAGTVASTFNRLDVSVRDPGTDAVIAYRWNKRLQTSGKAELFEYEAGDDISLIGIRPNGEERIRIRFKSWL